MTSNPTPDRTPYCRKIRYGITGAPILDGDDMDGSHAPGVGLAPKLIELVYSPARDGKPARVDASVTGDWTRFGEPDDFGGQVATHFKDGPDGWPAWLAEEARLHDPAAVPSVSAVDQTTRDRIRRVLAQVDGFDFDSLEPHDYQIQAAALLAVLPSLADRADVLRKAADELGRMDYDTDSNDYGYDTYRDAWNGGVMDGADLLRRMADEAQQPECTESVIYEVVGDWGVDSADSEAGARAAVAKWLKAYPKCGAYAQQRIVREWPDGSEWYGPWTDLPGTPAAVSAVPGRSAATSTGEEQPS